MTTYNKIIVDTLKSLKEEFEQLDGRDFKVYYKKVIVPANTTKTDMNEVWSSLHWPVSKSTSYPDFCSPWPLYEHEGDTEPSFRVHFVLSGENITNGWKALQTPIKHTIELLRLRRYDPDNIPDSDTFLDNFPKSEKEPVDDLHTNIWYEFLLKLSQENDCDILYESIKGVSFSDLPCTVDIEGLKTDALKASILALDYLLGKTEQKTADKSAEKPAETKQNTTPAKPERESRWWRLYEITLKVIIDAVLKMLRQG